MVFKKEQKWVSELPEIFWVGEVDYITGEKIYSDQNYLVGLILKSGERSGWYNPDGTGKITNARNYKYLQYNMLPYSHVYGRGLYNKVIAKIVTK